MDHISYRFGGQVGVDQQHVGGSDIKIFRQLRVCDHIFHVLGQALSHVIVDFIIGLTVPVVGRGNQQGKHNKKHGKHLDNAFCKSTFSGDNGFVFGFLQRLIKNEDQCRQYRYAAENAEQHALCHDNAEVASHGEGHKAQSRETGDRSNRAADNAFQGFADGYRHSIFVVAVFFTLFIVAVPEENGIVHSYGKLQHSGQRFCDVRDFAHEVIGAEVQKDHHADAGQKDKRDKPAIEKYHHSGTGKEYGNTDINRFFFLTKIL